ncbi:hypothetical protein tinsulaeT_28740 [Thalassotalea insulae]|uniref:Uncharacterized protein n=1 Tax=Thalassotalea insulae TaxID=2056778 RepID=A0ABQ6GW17_9GAMM|nr:hypothetical protein tinsulaeT_28740 [Thalassotalea insulae]
MPLLRLDTIPTLVQCIKFCEQLAGHGSEVTRAPRLPLSGEERARVEKLYNDAVATRIDPSKFNLDQCYAGNVIPVLSVSYSQ